MTRTETAGLITCVLVLAVGAGWLAPGNWVRPAAAAVALWLGLLTWCVGYVSGRRSR